MFLSQIKLNPHRRDAARILSSPHVLHGAVMKGFPDPTPTESGRILWRLDQTEYTTQVYIVSPQQPDLTHLAEQAGWPTLADGWSVRPYQQFLDRIENGHHYGFRLTANPVRSAPLKNGRRGKVFGHVTAAQQENWLLQRQEPHGFHVDDAIEPESGEIFTHPDGSPQKAIQIGNRRTLTFSRRETSITLRVATYEGLLTVTDRDAFVRSLCFGIGRGKGYGCGLMTLAPIR